MSERRYMRYPTLVGGPCDGRPCDWAALDRSHHLSVYEPPTLSYSENPPTTVECRTHSYVRQKFGCADSPVCLELVAWDGLSGPEAVRCVWERLLDAAGATPR